MARDRYDDEDEDTRGRGRDDRDDRDDDYDDRPRRKQLTGMDAFFGNTGTFVLALFITFCCCSPFGIVMGAIGLGTCSNPDSKRNAMIVLILGVVMLIVGIIVQVMKIGAGGGGFGN